eukprot:gene24635-31005_t
MAHQHSKNSDFDRLKSYLLYDQYEISSQDSDCEEEVNFDEFDEDLMFKSANTASVLGQFASFEASMNIDRSGSGAVEDDCNGSGVRGCIYNNASYWESLKPREVTGAEVSTSYNKNDKGSKHSLPFDPFASQGASKKARMDIGAGCTPMVPVESFLAPSRFTLEGQSKDCVLSLMEDHLDNQEASFTYSHADSTWHVSLSDQDCAHKSCEFILSLYATVENCSTSIQSNYLLEALHLYGDADLFRTSFEGVRAIFQDVDEVESYESSDPMGGSEDVNFFAKTENRATLIEHIEIPVATACGAEEDSIVSIVLHQRRVQGVERIAELSTKSELVIPLVEVGAVQTLLTVFTHCVGEQSEDVVCLDNAIIPSAVVALSHLVHHKDAQELMACDGGLLNYLRERALCCDEDRLLRSEVTTVTRSMLVLLCRSHPEVVLRVLGVENIQDFFTSQTAAVHKIIKQSPTVSTRSDKLHYSDSPYQVGYIDGHSIVLFCCVSVMDEKSTRRVNK